MGYPDIEKALGQAKLVEEETDAKNADALRMASAMDTMTSTNSFGNYFLGNMKGRDTSASDFVKSTSKKAPTQSESLQGLLDSYRGTKMMKDDAKTEASELAMRDAKSEMSAKARRDWSEMTGKPVPEGASAFDLTNKYGKMSEVFGNKFKNDFDTQRDSAKFAHETNKDEAKFGFDKRLAAQKSGADMNMKAFEQTGDMRMLGAKGAQEREMLGIKGGQSQADILAKGDQDRITKGVLSGSDQVKLAGDSPLGTKSTEFKMSKLNGTDKARLDNVRMAHEGINSMAEALNKGDKTWNLIGDNDFTLAERDFTESLGRMQSGGAISRAEERRFSSMAPKMGDSDDIRAKKIANLQAEMGNRFKTLGFSPQEFNISNVAYAPKSKSGDVVKSAVAAPMINDADKQAMQWAKENQGDPRAKGILQKLKDKGAF